MGMAPANPAECSESVYNVRDVDAMSDDNDAEIGAVVEEEDEELAIEEDEELANEENEEHVPGEENANDEFSNHFGHVVGEREEGDSEDSGDEIWRDVVIPNPLSDEEEDVPNGANSENPGDGDEEILKLGKCFSPAADFKDALLRYSLRTRYDIRMYVSNAKKLGVVCSNKESKCPWKAYCSYEKRKRKLQIKVFESKHTCIRSGYSKLLKCSTIAQLFEEKLRLDPSYKTVDMVAEIKSRYNLIVTEEQYRKTKVKLSKERRKRHEEQFGRIWDYEAEIHNSNAWTIVDIETIPGATVGSKQRFHRIYISFKAQRSAWRQYYIPIIGLDGAFLKWDIKGQLLAAFGRDSDNRIVPLAWDIVEIENDINWDWFMQHLKVDLGLGDGTNFAVISDKQKGLVKAILTQLPGAEHRQCAKHILGNWKRDNQDMELERLFWRIARSYTVREFYESMEAMRQINPTAFETLKATKPETWSRAYFKPGTCCNDILNNLSESFNKTIREARRKLVLDVLENQLPQAARQSYLDQSV